VCLVLNPYNACINKMSYSHAGFMDDGRKASKNSFYLMHLNLMEQLT
jgi:hypothetical protein